MGAAEADPTSVGDIRYPLQQAVVYVMSFASDGSTASTIVSQLRENSAVWVLAKPNLVVRSFPDSMHNPSNCVTMEYDDDANSSGWFHLQVGRDWQLPLFPLSARG